MTINTNVGNTIPMLRILPPYEEPSWPAHLHGVAEQLKKTQAISATDIDNGATIFNDLAQLTSEITSAIMSDKEIPSKYPELFAMAIEIDSYIRNVVGYRVSPKV